MNASIEHAVNEVNKSMNAQVSRHKTGSLSVTKKHQHPNRSAKAVRRKVPSSGQWNHCLQCKKSKSSRKLRQSTARLKSSIARSRLQQSQGSSPFFFEYDMHRVVDLFVFDDPSRDTREQSSEKQKNKTEKIKESAFQQFSSPVHNSPPYQCFVSKCKVVLSSERLRCCTVNILNKKDSKALVYFGAKTSKLHCN